MARRVAPSAFAQISATASGAVSEPLALLARLGASVTASILYRRKWQWPPLGPNAVSRMKRSVSPIDAMYHGKVRGAHSGSHGRIALR